MKRGKGTRPSTEYHPKSPAFRGIWVRPWGKRRDESKAISRFHNLPSPAITCLNANSDIEARCHLGFCVPGSAGSGRPKEGNSIKRREAVSKGQPSHHSEPGVLTAKWVCCKSTHNFWSKSNFLQRKASNNSHCQKSNSNCRQGAAFAGHEEARSSCTSTQLASCCGDIMLIISALLK